MTKQQIEQIVEDWHQGNLEAETLHEALGWTWEEYKIWAATDVAPER